MPQDPQVVPGESVPPTSMTVHDNAEVDKTAASYDLLRFTEERTRTLEHELRRLAEAMVAGTQRSEALQTELERLGHILANAEQRTRTLEYLASENLYIARFQVDTLQKLSGDLASGRREAESTYFRAADVLEIQTQHPIALESHDHVEPDSTTEGLVRPTPFVRHCIEKLGDDITCLDLGTGAGGLIYEFARNNVLAVGIDGSDFNARYKVGYWPFIPGNLFTCDITQPFQIKRRSTGIKFGFDLVSMWEVLEHIGADDLDMLLGNVREHMLPEGYFVGSISRIPYADKNGTPYHVTLQSQEWWAALFKKNGLSITTSHPFNTHFFCRGIGDRFQDIHNYFENPDLGFHFVARRDG